MSKYKAFPFSAFGLPSEIHLHWKSTYQRIVADHFQTIFEARDTSKIAPQWRDFLPHLFWNLKRHNLDVGLLS